MNLIYATVDSPIGTVHVAARARGVCAVAFHDRWGAEQERLRRRFGEIALTPGDNAAAASLQTYFAGDLDALDEVAVDAAGTDFQLRVWSALRSVPLGETASYASIAEQLGQPNAVRAVGAANGANPIAIVVPCHRVVGASGKLTGYAGGLERKRWLLEHERAISPMLF